MFFNLINRKLKSKIIAKSMISHAETLGTTKLTTLNMDTVYTEIAELSYDKEKSLLHIKILEDVSITVEKAKKLTESINQITNGRKHFALVDATNYFFIEDEALKYMAETEACTTRLGSAYYSMNLANRLTMHFFKVFHKPSYPLELFKKKEDAIGWIKLIRQGDFQLG